ncbi:DNA-binding transcriptional regulator YhcF (GntR family) [Pseudoclavibacter chungangensis]|nr:DNA-binding transcriptional regulator YhcF (GntR family) [Pseudoclavibacter chungangensis]
MTSILPGGRRPESHDGGAMLDETKPLFVQIAEQIENGVLDGTYPEGDGVPSTNELAQFLRVNPATAGKGLNLLVDRGVLHKRRGIGMFVSDGARERLVVDRTETFASEFVAPMLREAQKLGIDRAALTALIERESK